MFQEFNGQYKTYEVDILSNVSVNSWTNVHTINIDASKRYLAILNAEQFSNNGGYKGVMINGANQMGITLDGVNLTTSLIVTGVGSVTFQVCNTVADTVGKITYQLIEL